VFSVGSAPRLYNGDPRRAEDDRELVEGWTEAEQSAMLWDPYQAAQDED
jgi:hypothetical protein